MLLLGMVGSGLLFGLLLADFSQVRLIQVIQGAAVVTMGLNIVALWKQEARDPARTDPRRERPTFRASWRALVDERPVARACWSRWASAPPRSACRTSCSSRTAGRSSISASAPRRC